MHIFVSGESFWLFVEYFSGIDIKVSGKVLQFESAYANLDIREKFLPLLRITMGDL